MKKFLYGANEPNALRVIVRFSNETNGDEKDANASEEITRIKSMG